MRASKIFDYLKDYAGLNKQIRVVNFPITDNCNSRCTMCNVWKNNVSNEISPNEIARILSADTFSAVKHLGISGGEPSLRKDLVRCVAAIVDSLPLLETLSITSHGYNSSRWKKFIPLIKEVVERKGIDFSLNISIDGYADRHDLIRGIDGAFSKAEKTIEIAQSFNVKLQLQYTISTMNAYSMQLALEYAREKNIEIVFRVATNIERLYNSDRSEVFIDESERSFAADFFSSDELISQTRSLSRKLYYRRMQKWLSNSDGARKMPCYFKSQGVLLTSSLAVYPCSVAKKAAVEDLRATEYQVPKLGLKASREDTQNNYCDSCIHDQSGAWSPLDILSYKFGRLKITSIIRKILRLSNNLASSLLILPRLLSRLFLKNTSEESVAKISRATIIGAYGGEHVGDAAILGGVILRLKKHYKTEKIRILSFRPDRTNKWVRSLRIEGVNFEVVKLSKSNLSSSLSSTDGLIYAGGPIMDIPVNLSFYFYAALNAKSKGLPFIVEGVGLGPYKRLISKLLASFILICAHKITLRSSSNLKVLPFHSKFKVDRVAQDPAFDYLEYSKSVIVQGRYSSRENFEISSLDSYIAGRSKVLYVNLRPIWSAYATKDSESTVDDIVSNVLDSVASTINSLDSSWAVVFIPFNPDTYGFSDFSSFYQVIKRLNSERDYYVVEYEPGVPLMLDMLSRSSHLLAMRFHACIFGLSIDRNVYGIDYQIGAPGKVAALFDGLCNVQYQNVSALDKVSMLRWLDNTEDTPL